MIFSLFYKYVKAYKECIFNKIFRKTVVFVKFVLGKDLNISNGNEVSTNPHAIVELYFFYW